MEVQGYPVVPASLAYRDAQLPEFAVEMRSALLELGVAGLEVDEPLTKLYLQTDSFIASWESRTRAQLDGDLRHLAHFSDEQLRAFAGVFREAGIDLGDVPAVPAGDSIAWASVASAGVLALMDVLVDSEAQSFDSWSLAATCLKYLDVDAFHIATGLASDHESVLNSSSAAFFDGSSGVAAIAYRDRYVQLQWTEKTVVTVRPDIKTVLDSR